jgi:wyosine [tRNA(Phe)-imidazoG37] synthetase (radical SAM superfamily)
MKYVYGPVPSRRMGLSLGVSPIPKKSCNYSCVYCQLGRTDRMTNQRELYFPLYEILGEVDDFLSAQVNYDVITIVGEGEPTLYRALGDLIIELKNRTEKPVAVITNGALLKDSHVRKELMSADIVLPTLDATDEEMYRKINRPHKTIPYTEVVGGLRRFSKYYEGQLWLETMLVEGMNDSTEALYAYRKLLDTIRYDRLYINTPVRPPAENWVKAVSSEKIEEAVRILRGISIDMLVSTGFYSEKEDHLEAILSIIKRHPMNQHEILGFLSSRHAEDPEKYLKELEGKGEVEKLSYKGYDTYRFR